MALKINQISSNLTSRILKNKVALKGLEKISEHAISFSAGTSLLLSLTVRPLAIYSTPDVEKENKQYAIASSIGSGLMKYAIVESIALPIENAVKKIDNSADKFLKPKTITTLKNTAENISEAKPYKFLTQLIKLSTGFVTAIPKSILTIALIPIIMDALFFRHKNNQSKISKNPKADFETFGFSFTGNQTDKIPKLISKILNNEKLQKFALKYQNSDKDAAKHVTAMTDILLTSTYAYQTDKSKRIKENRKKALIYNNFISTFITIAGGYGLDKLMRKPAARLTEKIKQLHPNDPKVFKYIEGINILRPALIFAGIYYGILPIFSTYIAEKTDKFITRNSKNKTPIN